MKFEWDLAKEQANIEKHRISFSEAVESFSDPHDFKMMDHRHSNRESRFFWVGRTKSNRVLTTRYTERGLIVRIIGSAEWRKFRRL